MPTDLELLAQWRQGDNAAGSELFSRHFDALYRFFVNKLADEAEDLVQATWMACVRYADRVGDAVSFRAYLFTIARNQLYRAIKQRGNAAGADLTVSSILDLAPSPATVAAVAERDRALVSALRGLPVEAQVVLELHYWEDLSAAELAEVMGLPVGTAKTRLRRAKQLLSTGLRRQAQGTSDDALDDWVRSMRAKIGAKTSDDVGT